MASNQEDSLLEDRNHPGVQDTASAISFVEGTPSREVLLRIPQTSRNATIDQNFACGDVPLSSGSGGTNVLSYSHINTVIPPMPVLQGPMALQNNNMQPHAVSSGLHWEHIGSTTQLGPIRMPQDSTLSSMSGMSNAVRTQSEYRSAGQNLTSAYNQPLSHVSEWGNGASQKGFGNEKSLKPGTYDGNSSWSDYLVLFNMLADHLNWSNGQRAINLAINLRGTAQSVLSDLSPAQRGDFTALVSALSARFEPIHQSELYRAKIKSRLRQRGESIPELAQDIRKLVRLAYPTAPSEVREQLSKDCFIDSMNNADLEWSILQGKPKTVDDAIKLALEYEAFQRGKRGRQSDFRPFRACEETLLGGAGGRYEPGHQQSQYVPPATPQPLDNPYNNKQGANWQMKGNEEKGSRAQRRQGSNGGNKSCFYCGSQKHFIRNCEVRKNDMKNSVADTKRLEHPEGNCEATQGTSGNGC